MWGTCVIALCTSGIPARSHLKLISVQQLTLSPLLKIDAAVITRISSHHDNSLGLGCYRNLRFILLWLQKHRTGGKEEEKKPRWFFIILTFYLCRCTCCYEAGKVLWRGGEIKLNMWKPGKRIEEARSRAWRKTCLDTGVFFCLATRITLVWSYWNKKKQTR